MKMTLQASLIAVSSSLIAAAAMASAAPTPPELGGDYLATVLEAKGDCKIFAQYKITQTPAQILISATTSETLVDTGVTAADLDRVAIENMDGPMAVAPASEREGAFATDADTKSIPFYPEVIFDLPGRWETGPSGTLVDAVSGYYTKPKSFWIYGKKVRDYLQELNVRNFDSRRELLLSWTHLEHAASGTIVVSSQGCLASVLLKRK